eukprot:1041591-Pyramimonas_sp.AAC.1
MLARSWQTAMNARNAKAKKRAKILHDQYQGERSNHEMIIWDLSGALPAAKLMSGGESKGVALGRKRNPSPQDVFLASRACFMKDNGNSHIGVNQKRLLTAASKATLDRQQAGLEHTIRASSKCLSSDGGGP